MSFYKLSWLLEQFIHNQLIICWYENSNALTHIIWLIGLIASSNTLSKNRYGNTFAWVNNVTICFFMWSSDIPVHDYSYWDHKTVYWVVYPTCIIDYFISVIFLISISCNRFFQVSLVTVTYYAKFCNFRNIRVTSRIYSKFITPSR